MNNQYSMLIVLRLSGEMLAIKAQYSEILNQDLVDLGSMVMLSFRYLDQPHVRPGDIPTTIEQELDNLYGYQFLAESYLTDNLRSSVGFLCDDLKEILDSQLTKLLGFGYKERFSLVPTFYDPKNNFIMVGVKIGAENPQSPNPIVISKLITDQGTV